MFIHCFFSNWSHQKSFIFVLQRDESETWTSSLWSNTLELHQQDFRATNVIYWDECFENKTVETNTFLSLLSCSLNIYLNYILNKTIDDRDPPWMTGWNKKCAIKWKDNAYCKECVRSWDTLFDSLTYLKMDIIANLYFLYICIL